VEFLGSFGCADKASFLKPELDVSEGLGLNGSEGRIRADQFMEGSFRREAEPVFVVVCRLQMRSSDLGAFKSNRVDLGERLICVSGSMNKNCLAKTTTCRDMGCSSMARSSAAKIVPYWNEMGCHLTSTARAHVTIRSGHRKRFATPKILFRTVGSFRLFDPLSKWETIRGQCVIAEETLWKPVPLFRAYPKI
jgi:hypothetical protein